MISINLVIKNDERHCMPHLYIHATLYSMHRLVVPSGNENEDLKSMAFSLLKVCRRQVFLIRKFV